VSIIIQDVSKSFGDKSVLHGITHTMLEGKVNMIIGASGSGKSVLMKIIVGLLTPDAGCVIIDGLDMHHSPAKKLRTVREHIGMLFQSGALFSSMTVEQNVAFPLIMFARDLSRTQQKERVQFCLEAVQLPQSGKLFPSELSGGMKKRIALARAIALEPKYLFCDEPNSGLDPKTAEAIDELIVGLTHNLNTTTVVITHDMKSVLSHADHVLFIYKGAIEWRGSREEIKTLENPPLLDFLRTSGLLGGEFSHYLPQHARR
jgi:phospholipid/cholesterol/gamma-HCH transport system ATP-binding protein